MRNPGRGHVGFWIWLSVVLIKPTVAALFRTRWRGQQHLPRSGGAIVVSNHVSQADFATLAVWIWDSGRIPRFLIKHSLFRLVAIGRLLRGAKQIPVVRGSSAARQSLDEAVAAIGRGECVCIYPEGTVTRDPEFWPMQPRTGVARLALTTDAPVIPLAQWGPQVLLDVERRKFRPWRRPTAFCQAGPPLDLSAYRDRPLTAELLREVTDVIMGAVRDQLAEVRGETAPADFFRRPPARREAS
ncbi:MAG TPA: lysophospholipid acyltransferase family protein [Mycobacteriales bacterium]|nr:lysophospholipid acyltransferase family protein [Mycobacteriales bacterium]